MIQAKSSSRHLKNDCVRNHVDHVARVDNDDSAFSTPPPEEKEDKGQQPQELDQPIELKKVQSIPMHDGVEVEKVSEAKCEEEGEMPARQNLNTNRVPDVQQTAEEGILQAGSTKLEGSAPENSNQLGNNEQTCGDYSSPSKKETLQRDIIMSPQKDDWKSPKLPQKGTSCTESVHNERLDGEEAIGELEVEKQKELLQELRKLVSNPNYDFKSKINNKASSRKEAIEKIRALKQHHAASLKQVKLVLNMGDSNEGSKAQKIIKSLHDEISREKFAKLETEKKRLLSPRIFQAQQAASTVTQKPKSAKKVAGSATLKNKSQVGDCFVNFSAAPISQLFLLNYLVLI